MATTTPPPSMPRHSSRWSTPLAACVLALAATPLLGADRMALAVLACSIVGVFAVLDARIARGRVLPRADEIRSPWVVVTLSIAVFVCGAIPGLGVAVFARVSLGASALYLVAMCLLAWDRLRQIALELVIEAVIATAGLVLLSYALLLEPWLAPRYDTTTAIVAYVALSVLFCAFLIFGWLITVDREAKCPASTMMLACGGLLVVADAVALQEVFRGSGPVLLRGALAIIGVCVVASSTAHPSQRLLRMPALDVEAGKAEHRAVMAIGAVMAGPFLIVVNLLVPFGLSLAFVAMGSASLSVLVSAHVFRLLRRWGALEHDVHHDSLTGLPNRTFFNARLDLAIELARGERRTLAVMFLDLDRFKNVNDSLGHAAGNTLLIQVARRLRVAVDRSVTVARLAGDEFAILIPSVRNYKHTETIAKALIAAFGDPFEVGRRKVYVTPSIGVSHYPTDGLVSSELLEHADAAMYRAKERGRNTVEMYTGERRAQAVNRLDLETALHNAVDEHQLELYYQPKVNIATGRVTGVEALLRWDHPILGPIPPDEFIPIAEESGLIALIGEWTLIEGCTQALAWRAQGIKDVTVAVNLSPRQFQLQRVQDLVARVLRITHCPANLLELEVTESLALQDPDGVATVMAELHAMGVRCSIDDFGVGYSGLSYLDRFSFDAIKIDRKFVEGIDEDGAPIVTAVIAMAKGLQIDVIAEGVETMAQFEFLRRHGCDMMQGFLFSRPLPAREVEPLLRKVLKTPQGVSARSVGHTR